MQLWLEPRTFHGDLDQYHKLDERREKWIIKKLMSKRGFYGVMPDHDDGTIRIERNSEALNLIIYESK